jgi:hypothetical protein
MNAIRIELVFPENAPKVEIPGLLRSEGQTLTILGQDTPLLRATLTELCLAHPTAQMAAIPCFLGRAADFGGAHALVRCAFGQDSPASFNVKEAARRLGVSYSHLRKLVHLGLVKKVNGRVAAAELERYLRQPRPPRQPRRDTAWPQAPLPGPR